jgi:hypothetical protein
VPHSGNDAITGKDSRGLFTVSYFDMSGQRWGYVMSNSAQLRLNAGAKSIRIPGFRLNSKTLRVDQHIPTTVTVTRRVRALPSGRPGRAYLMQAPIIACTTYSIYAGSTGYGGPDLAYPNPVVFNAIADSCYNASTFAPIPLYHNFNYIFLGINYYGTYSQADMNSSSSSRFCTTYTAPVSATGSHQTVTPYWSSSYLIKDTLPGYTFPQGYSPFGTAGDTSEWPVGYPTTPYYNNDHKGFTCV